MATHPSILAWEIPWTEEPGELKDTTEQLTLSLHCSLILFLLLLLKIFDNICETFYISPSKYFMSRLNSLVKRQ